MLLLLIATAFKLLSALSTAYFLTSASGVEIAPVAKLVIPAVGTVPGIILVSAAQFAVAAPLLLIRKVRANGYLFAACAYSFLLVCSLDGLWDSALFVERVYAASALTSAYGLQLLAVSSITLTLLTLTVVRKSGLLTPVRQHRYSS